MLLAQLLAGLVADREVAHRGGVPLVGEDLRQRLGRREVGTGLGDGVEALLDLRRTTVGEGAHGLLAAGLGEEADGLHGEVVVGLVEPVAARLGEREDLGRTATAPVAGGAGLPGLEDALVEQLVEVPAHRRGREREPLGQGGRGRGTIDQDRPDDALTRRLVLPRHRLHDFHNVSVLLLLPAFQIRLA